MSSQQKEMLVLKAPNRIKQENVVQNFPNLLTNSKIYDTITTKDKEKENS